MSAEQDRDILIKPAMQTALAMTDTSPQDDSQVPCTSPVLTIESIISLFICRRCCKPYRDALTLPCGKSICKACIPELYDRESISYPDRPERRQGFVCPFGKCAKEHALGDCAVDVVLNKMVYNLRVIVAEEASLAPDAEPQLNTLQKIWSDAEMGQLYSTTDNNGFDQPVVTTKHHQDDDTLLKLREATRAETDCQVCYALFYDPFTTGCGHTFCRPCLYRILDHSRYCPICRRQLSISPGLTTQTCPTNEAISAVIASLWPDELNMRREALEAEEALRKTDLQVPLFICTLAFPQMPTFLHIFEPRYKLMIRRALEGDRTFGMVPPKLQWAATDTNFYELGTMLRIVNVEFYPDGRCLLETVGLCRFRVVRHSALDGYTIAETERIDDISLEEEEATEARQVTIATEEAAAANNIMSTANSREPIAIDTEITTGSTDTEEPFSPKIISDLERMPTKELMAYARKFVTRMQEQSAPWIAANVLNLYGQCPLDPAIFPWWLASILPVKSREKYRLLSTASVRERLKICCAWILEWETTVW